MNRRRILLAWAIVCVLRAHPAAGVEVGDSMAAVTAELGPPTGKMAMGRKAVWMYPDGSVDFQDGKVVTVGLPRSPAAGASAVDAEQILYYPFDQEGELGRDHGGQENPGTVDGSGFSRAGAVGGALEVYGDRGHIQLQRNLTLTPPYSVTAWVYLRSVRTGMPFPHYNGRTILMRGDIRWSGRWDYIFNVNANGKLGFVTHPHGSRADTLEAPDAFPLNRWVFVAFVHDGTVGRLFQDGRAVAENGNMLPGDRHNGARTVIGMCYNSEASGANRSHWDGFLDELRVYGRALSAGDVTRLASRRGAGTATAARPAPPAAVVPATPSAPPPAAPRPAPPPAARPAARAVPTASSGTGLALAGAARVAKGILGEPFELWTWIAIAGGHAKAGDRAAAETALARAAEAAEYTRSPHTRARALAALAADFAMGGDADTARSFLARARNEVAALPDDQRKDGALAALARGYAELGLWPEALDFAARISQASEKAGVLADLAGRQARAGAREAALELLAQADRLIPDIPFPTQQARAWVATAMASHAADQKEDAARRFRQALAVVDGMGAETPAIGELAHLAGALARCGEKAQADALLARARRAASAVTTSFEKAMATGWVAVQYAEAGDTTRALEMAREIDSPMEKGWTLSSIASRLAEAGRFVQALELLQGVDSAPFQASGLVAIAEAYRESGAEPEPAAVRLLSEWRPAAGRRAGP